MKDNSVKIEQRIENMKKFYYKAGEIIDDLPEAIPEKTRTMLKDVILGDKELKSLMEGIDAHRPPRIFLIGRTGVGKSSLINALCGSYVAKVSDTTSCTETANSYICMDGDRVLMEILDTRGIAESESLNLAVSAEEMLIDQINEFSPDVAIMMLNCTHRDDIVSDVEFMKKVAKEYQTVNGLRLPIVVVVNKCDEMAPSRFKNPSEYPKAKREKIVEMVQYYKNVIIKNRLKIDSIVAVSSLIDWQTSEGDEIAVEEIDKLPQHEIDHLEIAFDGRHNIEKLLDFLLDAIQDSEAQMGLRMAARLNEVVKRISRHLTNIFSAISATVALTPIPTSDVYILIIIQAVLVLLIASLSGRDISFDAAKEFIFSFGGITGAGYGLRFLAQQAAKLINGIWPGAGSAVSSAIAAGGTNAIGQAAILYYIDDKSMEYVRENFEKNKS